jgi:hypothetical protein
MELYDPAAGIFLLVALLDTGSDADAGVCFLPERQ